MSSLQFIFRSGGCLLAAAALLVSVAAQGDDCPTNRTELVFATFNDLSALQLNGSAATDISNPVTTDVGPVLRLTDALSQGGSAFLKCPISLQGAAGFTASFSSFFSFRISNPTGISDGDGQGADGLVFVVQTQTNNVGGVGVGIGYQGIAKSVGIEFDTYNNGPFSGDPDGNHIAIDLNGEFGSGPVKSIAKRMNDGDIWHAWVDYDGANKQLEVRLSLETLRPTAADLSMTVDLAAVLQQPDAFVGFTSGTGAAGGNHDILNWILRAEYNPVISTPGTLTVAIADARVTEGNSGTKTVSVPIQLSEPADANITVLASTQDGTAKAGQDYVALVDVPVTFESGETSKTIEVQILGDTDVEPDETFSVVIRKPGVPEESPDPGDDGDGVPPGEGISFVIGDAEAIVTIVNDDSEGEGELIATIVGPAVLNPQTGLFEQKVRVHNNGEGSAPGVRVTLAGLPGDVIVFNASGTTEGGPYVDSRAPLAGDETVELLVEYFRTSRQQPPDPSVSAVSVEPQTPASSGGTAPSVNRILLLDDRILVEWLAAAGRRYAVEYGASVASTNASDWKRAVPEIVAPANRVQWFDDGPPKTESHPLSVTNRFYRVILLPTNAPTADRIGR